MSIKHHLGKLPEVEELLGEYHETLARYGFTELHFTSVHALLAGSLESEHKDLFDRALVSQAMSEGLPIVSKDPAIHSFKGIKPLW